MSARPTAAPAHFPYDHRSLEQIAADRRAEIARIAEAQRVHRYESAQAAVASGPSWCQQCEQRRWPMQASQCASAFCSLRSAAA
jgi:hypothetical protein